MAYFQDCCTPNISFPRANTQRRSYDHIVINCSIDNVTEKIKWANVAAT